MRREVTVELSSQGFWKTGIRSDVCQVTPVNADTCTCAAVHAHGSDTCTLSTHTTEGAHSEKYTHWNREEHTCDRIPHKKQIKAKTVLITKYD